MTYREPVSDYGRMRAFLVRQGVEVTKDDDIVELLFTYFDNRMDESYDNGYADGYNQGRQERL